jgi:hypothetical protein
MHDAASLHPVHAGMRFPRFSGSFLFGFILMAHLMRRGAQLSLSSIIPFLALISSAAPILFPPDYLEICLRRCLLHASQPHMHSLYRLVHIDAYMAQSLPSP